MPMKKKSYLPPFGKILIITLFLVMIGGSGLIFTLFMLEPRLGPRWMFFFFLVIFGAGIALPGSYIIQRRFAKDDVPSRVLVREAILFGTYLALLAWLQLGRILTNLITAIIGIGFLLFEMLLRMAERSTFNPGGADEEL
jgi:hypothetical protein